MPGFYNFSTSFMIVHEISIIVQDVLRYFNTVMSSRMKSKVITAHRSLLHPIAAYRSTLRRITADCIFLQRIAAHHISNAIRCDSM